MYTPASKYFHVKVIPEGTQKPTVAEKAIGYNSIDVQWNSVPGAISYAVAIRKDGGSFSTYTYDCKFTSFSCTGLIEDTSYQILVQARFKHDRFSTWDDNDLLTRSTLRSVPVIIGTEDGDGTCKITWKNNFQASRYAVVESENGVLKNINVNDF